MATLNNTTHNQPLAESAHKPFRWHSGPDADEFLENILDLSRGIALSLEIAEASDIKRDIGWEPDEAPPAVCCTDAEFLRRSALASARILAMLAEAKISLNDNRYKEQQEIEREYGPQK